MISDQRLGLHTLFSAQHAEQLARPPSPRRELVSHGDVSRLATLASLTALRNGRALLEAWARRPHRDHDASFATAWAPPNPCSDVKLMLSASPSEVVPLYEGNFTVALHHIEDFIPELRVVCRALERDIDLPLGSIYAEAFTAQQGTGAQPHFDQTTTINIQLEGTKTWWFADNPAVEHPPRGMSLGAVPHRSVARVCTAPIPRDLPPEPITRTALALPGSVTFVPAGLIHATRTHAASLALLFTIRRSLTADRLARRVERKLAAVESLRASLLQRRGMAETERALAAQVIRRFARELERKPSTYGHVGREHYQLREGLSLTIADDGNKHTLSIGDARDEANPYVAFIPREVARLLSWVINHRSPSSNGFDVRELAEAHPDIDVHVLRSITTRLRRSRILVRTTDRARRHLAA